MKYQGKEIEILSNRVLFGKSITQVRILSSGQILDIPDSDLEENSAVVSSHEIVFKAIAARIRNEVNSQKLLAPFESSILPLPHQILALEKVMQGNYLRFLMADEVGMGKTIEAGLVLKELKLRGIVKRTLVIVPKSAMLQWKQEMKKHFNENFYIYDSEYINTLTRTFTRLEAENEINIWSQHNQLIVSMDALKPIETRQGWSKEKVEEYNRYRIESVLEADFDLLIIDECHKVGGSSFQVGRHQMADILCNAIPNVLLLSATPHRGKSDHFRRLLSLLDSDAFAGEGMPALKELEPYVVRTEKRQAIDYNGKPLFNKRRTETVEVEYDQGRHRKQQLLYEAVSEYVTSGFNLAQQTKNSSYGFVMILFQRMMSSSTNAIVTAMERRAVRLAGEKKEVTRESVIDNIQEFGYEGQMELDFEQKITNLIEETHANYATELDTLNSLVHQAKDCQNTETDAKVEYLLEKLNEIKRKEQNPDTKFLIFTEFIGTQEMLKKVLEDVGGYVCEGINGSLDFESRIDALRKFKEKAQVLISTDAAGESLNMQFAHIVINYDLPWNPMIVEQRIGRVDRIGQNHEVYAINLLMDNSVDKRVYEVIETKLNQILQQLGIDKTSDVLDSTLERDGVHRLYLTSLLNPDSFKRESEDWLSVIKEKLLAYKSTEGSLPTLNSSEITADKTDAVKYSPLPKWLEILSINYLKANKIPYTALQDGIRFKFPGIKDQIYTFNIKESINNPIPEPLSLQHEIIQTMLVEAVPYNGSQSMPVVKLNGMNSVGGYWSLWHLEVKNNFETQQIICPIFIAENSELYPAFAQKVWNKLSSDSLGIESFDCLTGDESAAAFRQLLQVAESTLEGKYLEIERNIGINTEKNRQNKEKAFEFQERQLRKVGIENIRNSRLQRLDREKERWSSQFEAFKQIIPDMKCLIAIKVVHG